MEGEKKVYCSNCKYLRWSVIYDYDCVHPDNKEKHSVDLWLHKKVNYTSLSHPKDINKNNDCKWFEEKGKK